MLTSAHCSLNLAILLQGVGDSSQGFLNCIFFCFLNLKVFNLIKGAILHYVCCQKSTFQERGREADIYEKSVTAQNNNKSFVPSTDDEKKPLLSPVSGQNYYGVQGDGEPASTS